MSVLRAKGFIEGLGYSVASLGVYIDVTQNSHGFSLPANGFIPVYNNSGTWTGASASSTSTLAQGFIVSILDTDTFRIQTEGPVVISGGHGLTDGQTYYLSNSAGAIATSAGAQEQEIGTAVSSNAFVLRSGPKIPGSSGSGGSVSWASAVQSGTTIDMQSEPLLILTRSISSNTVVGSTLSNLVKGLIYFIVTNTHATNARRLRFNNTSFEFSTMDSTNLIASERFFDIPPNSSVSFMITVVDESTPTLIVQRQGGGPWNTEHDSAGIEYITPATFGNTGYQIPVLFYGGSNFTKSAGSDPSDLINSQSLRLYGRTSKATSYPLVIVGRNNSGNERVLTSYRAIDSGSVDTGLFHFGWFDNSVVIRSWASSASGLDTTANAANVYIEPSSGKLLEVTSSNRYKKHIEDYELDLSGMANSGFQLRQFDHINGQTGVLGLIAEEVEALLPEGVFTQWIQYQNGSQFTGGSLGTKRAELDESTKLPYNLYGVWLDNGTWRLLDSAGVQTDEKARLDESGNPWNPLGAGLTPDSLNMAVILFAVNKLVNQTIKQVRAIDNSTSPKLGVWDASVNSPALSDKKAPLASIGFYVVASAGSQPGVSNGEAFSVGDRVYWDSILNHWRKVPFTDLSGLSETTQQISGDFFPSGPVNGQVFYRQDLAEEYRYDEKSSSWLGPATSIVFGIEVAVNEDLLNNSGLVSMELRGGEPLPGVWRLISVRWSAHSLPGDSAFLIQEHEGTFYKDLLNISTSGSLLGEEVLGLNTSSDRFLQVRYKSSEGNSEAPKLVFSARRVRT